MRKANQPAFSYLCKRGVRHLSRREVQSQSHFNQKQGEAKMKMGLYANIAAKKDRIKAGSGEKMRKPGTKGAPTAAAFKAAAKTAKGKKK